VGGRAKMRIRRARAGSGLVKHFVQRASRYAFGAVSQRLKRPHRKANPVSRASHSASTHNALPIAVATCCRSGLWSTV
ncbi:MAG: hypothetical protein JSU86_00775, partial [Phycisphaerales bacterium]